MNPSSPANFRRRFPSGIISHWVWLCFRFCHSFRNSEEMMAKRGVLGSYAAAKKELLPLVEHRRHRWLNNRAENSHQPPRERKRRTRGFKSPGHAQRFLLLFGVIALFFHRGRHLLAAVNYREIMRRCFSQWRKLFCLQPAI
jgi:transposase-like protein